MVQTPCSLAPLMEAIVLAGGLGTRLRAAVADLPKPMAPMSGRPFLEYLLEYWIQQGVRQFIISVAYKHELIQKHFGFEWKGTTIEYAVDEGWGTGGGLLQALSKKKTENNPFLVVNGDTYFEVPLNAFLQFHQNRSAQATLALLDLPGAAGGRVILDAEQKVSSFEPAASQTGLINGGVYLFEPHYFSAYTGPQAFSLEKDFLANQALRGNACYGYLCAAPFGDIGTPESCRACAELLGAAKFKK